MFTGIVCGCCPVIAVDVQHGLTRFSVKLPEEIIKDLVVGASVSVDGVCLTTVSVEDSIVSFDVVEETLQRTTLSTLFPGRHVNIERSAKFGMEIGGHLVSGHVFGVAKIARVEETENNKILTFECPCSWMKYILTKGFIALDGVSLTVIDAHKGGWFTVTLIPETLRMTTFGRKGQNEEVNLEIDPHTQVIVETVERLLAEAPSSQSTTL